MAQRFFIVPVQSSDAAEEDLNTFLSSHKVLTIDRRWVDLGANSFWAFCVDFIPTSRGTEPGARTAGSNRNRVDYKDVLAPDEFAVFSTLRQVYFAGLEMRPSIVLRLSPLPPDSICHLQKCATGGEG